MDSKKIYKKGYTTGVFDLFHQGHLRILQKAKLRCEHLIVGVSSDELVVSYKFRPPIMSLEERIEIIGALRCVDEVVVQENLNKIKAWEKYKFDVHFHGTDWKDSDLYRNLQLEFKKVGVDSVFFEYTKETSTSILKERVYQLMKSLQCT
ncbi:adenylyltransferase/cytidyltransferase family protein [Gammaproteobacteria bacterium]|nr:adenylyltransferase/cytidyltransferase family protein [Gammaproteobacteria bacterium]